MGSSNFWIKELSKILALAVLKSELSLKGANAKALFQDSWPDCLTPPQLKAWLASILDLPSFNVRVETGFPTEFPLDFQEVHRLGGDNDKYRRCRPLKLGRTNLVGSSIKVHIAWRATIILNAFDRDRLESQGLLQSTEIAEKLFEVVQERVPIGIPLLIEIESK